MYVYMYMCVYVCMYMWTYVYMYLCLYVYMYQCILISLYLCIYVSMHLCIFAYIYLCFCVSICLDISRIQSQIMHTRNPITNQSQNFVIGRLGVLNDVIEFCFMKLSVASPCCPTINVCEFCVVLQIHRQIGGCR